MFNFCTLFNKNYLDRGLALHHSLIESCDESFTLYIYPFDQYTYDYLTLKKLKNVIIVAQSQFENQALLNVKTLRTSQEYCWTCTPSIIKFTIEHYRLDHCTYIDADLFFYKSPKILLDEIKINDAILITEHDYYAPYDQSQTSGIYCVQFIMFKNNNKGMLALNWWVDKCIEWCFCRFEDNKFGDQKYLDDWPERFEGVHVLNRKEEALAPWNIQKYTKNELKEFPVFFHFHSVKQIKPFQFYIGGYKIPRNAIDKLYVPYLIQLYKNRKILKNEGIILEVELQPDRLFLMKNRIKALWGIHNLINIPDA